MNESLGAIINLINDSVPNIRQLSYITMLNFSLVLIKDFTKFKQSCGSP